jgi:hypothetical protein
MDAQSQDLYNTLMNGASDDFWWADETITGARAFLDDPQCMGELLTHAQRQGIKVWHWHKAVEAVPCAEVEALIASVDAPICLPRPQVPPLPDGVRCDPPTWTTWLHRYAAHSAQWAPRAAPGYHTAVGLWVLSTIAARRLVAHMGSTEVYPTLFFALIAESTHWTKTTAASIGVRLIRRSGCGHLLSPDRTTPQFLLKLMAGNVSQDYGNKREDEQAEIRKTLGFAAQRGWFYEEWGGMLHQMRRVDSPHAELNKLLIVLEGGAERFETGTIQRGLERIEAPYLALLGNATPHDVAPFMEEGDAWWHDGFWPRFICVTPPWGATPSRAPRPREAYHVPAEMIRELHDWHERLGSPSVEVCEVVEASGKRTGRWKEDKSPPPETTMTLAPDVYDAYERYNDALLELCAEGQVPPDLTPWYARAHEKALRVAMLLASVHDQTRIALPFWEEAQTRVEGWRTNLHELIAIVDDQGQGSPHGRRRAKLERRIERLLALNGPMTARALQRHMHAISSHELQAMLESMVKIGILSTRTSGKKILYLIFTEEGTIHD